MKQLTLLRHAKAVSDPAYAIDRERPLAPRGREDAQLIGRMLARAELVPNLIVTSPAVRARQTAELAARAADFKSEIRVADAIYLGDAPDLLEVVLALPDEADHVMLVGHNPGFEELAGLLLGVPAGAAGLSMPTGAAAHFILSDDAWAATGAGRGLLQWLVIPKVVKKLAD